MAQSPGLADVGGEMAKRRAPRLESYWNDSSMFVA